MRFHAKTFKGSLTATSMQSPIGQLVLVASPQGMRAVLSEQDLEEPHCRMALSSVHVGELEIMTEAQSQLKAYFLKQIQDFHLKMDPVGTEFQMEAWKVLQQIPYGETISYSEQAERLGSRDKRRAVGGANAKNPLAIIVPCHRVIGQSGKLTGFASGISVKKQLLLLEANGLFADNDESGFKADGFEKVN